jgi:hypothetical protein
MNTEKLSSENETSNGILGAVSNRNFWLIQYGSYGVGYDSDITLRKAIYWGTFIEAARQLIKNDESIGKGQKRFYRKIELFNLPDVSKKRKPFYVC